MAETIYEEQRLVISEACEARPECLVFAGAMVQNHVAVGISLVNRIDPSAKHVWDTSIHGGTVILRGPKRFVSQVNPMLGCRNEDGEEVDSSPT